MWSKIFKCTPVFYNIPVCICAQSLSHVWLFATPCSVATRLLCLWNFPGANTGVGCHFLLQGIFPTQGSNLHLLCLHWQADSLPLAPHRNPNHMCKIHGKCKTMCSWKWNVPIHVPALHSKHSDCLSRSWQSAIMFVSLYTRRVSTHTSIYMPER